ncbi:glycosyltransferase family 4 protein [Leptospira interrogans]|nr:glycosyltransferase family 1 protein [Leptospira interrogans]
MQNYGGISRYFYEIMTRMRKNFDLQFDHSILYSSNEYLKDRELFPLEREYAYKDWLPSIRFRGMYRIFHFFQWLGFLPFPERKMRKFIEYKIRKSDFDIFHPTYYDPYFIKILKKKKKPYVLTVHDFIHELFPDYFSDAQRVIEQKRIMIQNASGIITISESTKKDLFRFYDFDENKIKVIKHGVSFLPLSSDRSELFFDKKEYILFIGNRYHYKNFSFFLNSIEQIFRDFSTLNLICAGGGIFSADEILLIKNLGLMDRIFQYDFKNDQELIQYYKDALLFVFPSQYEGFGIPLLEAFNCGCPVACSNTSSFPEVAGDAAFYFDPNDSDSIYKTVLEAINNQGLRKEKVRKGRIRIQEFSWDKATNETIRFYYNILGNLSGSE